MFHSHFWTNFKSTILIKTKFLMLPWHNITRFFLPSIYLYFHCKLQRIYSGALKKIFFNIMFEITNFTNELSEKYFSNMSKSANEIYTNQSKHDINDNRKSFRYRIRIVSNEIYSKKIKIGMSVNTSCIYFFHSIFISHDIY